MIGGAVWILFSATRAQEAATIRTTGGVPQYAGTSPVSGVRAWFSVESS